MSGRPLTLAELRAEQLKWDRRFLGLAEHVAGWSKDPSTKCGAVIVAPDKSVISIGYNGFPRSIEDTPARLNDRETKYAMVIHAEMNAMMTANSSVRGSTVYVWPFMPCDRCCVHLIQAGIIRAVAPVTSPDKLERWGAAFDRTRALFREAGVELSEVEL